MNWQLAGHKKQLEFLESAIKKDKLAHAYTFAGPDSVGKRTAALRLAQMLLCEKNAACSECGQCKTFLAKSNADFLEVDGREGIKIEQVRDLTYKLSLKPYSAKYKVAVIDQAENLNIEAANALLKSLEEPKPQTVIILVTTNPDRLPKTIISRTQKITFGLVPGEEFAKFGGKPGLALRMANDPDFLETLAGTENFYQTFMNAAPEERLIAAYEIADMETHEIKSLLESWLLKLQQVLERNPDKQLAEKISQIAASRRFLDQNVNTKLLLTNLMLNT